MKVFLASLLLSVCVTAFGQGKADAILGYWYTGENGSMTEIYKSNGKYYGKLAYVVEASKNKVDAKNPDASKRTRKILGLTFLESLVYDADENEWVDGSVYNIQDGKSYTCYVELKDANTLQLTGYIGVRMLGKTRTWKRASAADVKAKLGK